MTAEENPVFIGIRLFPSRLRAKSFFWYFRDFLQSTYKYPHLNAKRILNSDLFVKKNSFLLLLLSYITVYSVTQNT